MEKYQDVVQDRAGNALSGLSVTILNTGTETPTTIYSDDGITPASNPLTTDASGRFEFYVAVGTYDIRVSGTGVATTNQTGVKIGTTDATSLPAASIPVTDAGAYFVAEDVEGVLQEIGAKPAVVTPTWVAAGGGYDTNDQVGLLGQTILAQQLMEGPLLELDVDEGAVSSPMSLDVGSSMIRADVYADHTFSAFTLPVVTPYQANTIGYVVSFTLEVANVGSAWTITWPAEVVWPDGTVPTPTAGVDVYTFYTRDGGTTWRGALVGNYVS